jgi:hypothetical protein
MQDWSGLLDEREMFLRVTSAVAEQWVTFKKRCRQFKFGGVAWRLQNAGGCEVAVYY